MCGSVARGRVGEAAGVLPDSRSMLTFVFAVWSAARALGWPCELATPDADEAPVLPRLRSARASSDLSTLSTTTTSSSQTSTGDHSKRSTARLARDTRFQLNSLLSPLPYVSLLI
ncbi:unnamed protein product, partial [Iphiclides podalirius]